MRRIGVAFLALSLLVLPSCTSYWPQETLEEAYQESLIDTQTAERGEISTNLEAIVPSNPDVTWEGEAGNSRILVGTWTTWDGYEKLHLGQGPWVNGREVWVFLPTEATRWIHDHRFELLYNPTLRFQELLGMPPKDETRWFVELWVDPNEVFRPSPDPEITDRTAELDFPQSTESVTVDPNYTTWFNDLLAVSYTGPTAHPWTRLGYTYDWALFRDDHIGLSEFVIRKDATLEVYGVWTTESYGK